MKLPGIKISSYYILIATVFLFGATLYQLYLYGQVHWGTRTESSLTQIRLDRLYDYESTVKAIEENRHLTEFFSELKESNSKINRSSYALMAIFSMYHLTGFLCFLVSLISVFCKPSKISIICLVVGFLGLVLALGVM